MARNTPVLLTDVPSPLLIEEANLALADGRLSDFLLSFFGDVQVPSSDGKSNLTLKEWYSNEKHVYYLKDWHVNKATKDSLFRPPDLFKEDWLNEISDYQFLYWGERGSSTARHSDVMDSFSWSLNLQGVKKWTFYRNSYDRLGIAIYQPAMSAVFVPSGVEHEVENLSECISINCNWFNRFNAHKVYDFLKRERNSLIREIEGFGVRLEIDEENKTDNIEVMMPAACDMTIKQFYTVLKRHEDVEQAVTLIEEIKREFSHLVDR